MPVSNLAPSAHDQQSSDALFVCPWTDAKTFVCPIVHLSDSIPCGPHQAACLIASPFGSGDLVATGGTIRSINGVTESYDRYPNFSASYVDTTFSDYISENNSSPCACRAINMIEGHMQVLNQAPSIHEEHSNNIVVSSHRTDADNSVLPIANLRGTIPYSSPQKVLLNDSLNKDT